MMAVFRKVLVPEGCFALDNVIFYNIIFYEPPDKLLRWELGVHEVER